MYNDAPTKIVNQLVLMFCAVFLSSFVIENSREIDQNFEANIKQPIEQSYTTNEVDLARRKLAEALSQIEKKEVLYFARIRDEELVKNWVRELTDYQNSLQSNTNLKKTNDIDLMPEFPPTTKWEKIAVGFCNLVLLIMGLSLLLIISFPIDLSEN